MLINTIFDNSVVAYFLGHPVYIEFESSAAMHVIIIIFKAITRLQSLLWNNT